MSVWADVVVVVATWLVTGGVTWGLFKGRMDALTERILKIEAKAERDLALFVTRSEYNSRQQDIRDQLQRIESKLDNIWGKNNMLK